MTAVCTNVYMIMFKVYTTALVYFSGYARAATLITYITLALITDYG